MAHFRLQESVKKEHITSQREKYLSMAKYAGNKPAPGEDVAIIPPLCYTICHSRRTGTPAAKQINVMPDLIRHPVVTGSRLSPEFEESA
jgi:hypothetical protein